MTEFQLRIFAPDEAVSRVEVLRGGSALAVGQALIDSRKLRALDDDPKAYGAALREVLFASAPIARAYEQAIAGGELRFRLLIDPDAGEAHSVCWERLILPINGEDLPAATSPQCPFSRYVALDAPEPPTLSGGYVQLLLAVASPNDLRQLTPIDTAAEIENLIEAWGSLLENSELRVTILTGGALLPHELHAKLLRLGCRLVELPATIDLIRECLTGADALHLVAHGNLTADRKAVMVLQKDDGGLALVEEDMLVEKFNVAGLRFVFLQSCKSSGGGAQTGLAPRLVQLGVAGVVAMQDFVPMGDAREFSSTFYKTLVREGAVDVAANAGRQALLRANSTNYSIPVLFSRLKDGQIWQPDPLRTATRHVAADCRMEWRVQHPFPIDVVLVRSGLEALQHGIENATGPRLGIAEGAKEALKDEEANGSPFVLMIGSRGRAKTTHMRALFADVASQPLDSHPRVPAQLYSTDCAASTSRPALTVAKAMARVYQEHGFDIDSARILTALAEQSFLFLVDGDAELSAADRAGVVALLADLHSTYPQHKFCLTADASLFDWTIYPEDTIALVIQPMNIDRVIEYLEGQEDAAVRGLVPKLRESALFDLASVPWLLRSLMEDAREGACIDSRTIVLGRFVREGMALVGGPPGMRPRAEEALNRLAWRMQTGRQVDLAGPEVYGILAEVRANREFPLEVFLTEIKQSRLLVNSGDEGARFAYSGLQSYFCARYLNASAGRKGLLEDITATLGRLPRLKWWEDTLVLLAGMTNEADSLLRVILAGSALTEGEQVLLATRCLHEARRATDAQSGGIGTDVVDQIVDSLIWRSHPQNVRSVSHRGKAIESLALLPETRVIAHLFCLAVEKIRTDIKGKPCFDYSGVRGSAVLALRCMPEAALAYAKSDPRLSANAALQALLEAWLSGDLRGLGSLLELDDPSVSAVAAFALSTIKDGEALDLLVRRFEDFAIRPGESDIMWAITDTLCLLSPIKVTERAILPFLDKPEWAHHVAYMIGRLGIASLDGPEVLFLRRCLLDGDPYVQSRALRSYATILSQQRETPGSAQALTEVRTLCHDLVVNNFAAAAKRGCINLASGFSPEGRWQLRYQAFESLRAIGDGSSVEVLRQMRTKCAASGDRERFRQGLSLSHLSFEVGEEIYWRLTGGLAGETYRPLSPGPTIPKTT
jgi:hypothetical protein